MKNMLIVMWTITFGLMVIVDMNSKAAMAHIELGDMTIAKQLIDNNWLFMASLAVMALTSIFATGIALRKFLA